MALPKDPLPYVVLASALLILGVAVAWAPKPEPDEEEEDEEYKPFVLVEASYETPMGKAVVHEFELQHVCGGPYEVELVAGALPPGLELETDPPRLVGTATGHGTYEFVVRATDTDCDPPEESEARYVWKVSR